MMFDKYPYTSFSEMNLDYILSRVNDFERRLDEIESHINDYKNYIRDVSIENNAYLKAVNGLGVTKTFSLPSGNHVCIDLYNENLETVNIYELNVDDIEHYSTNMVGNRPFYEPLYAGVPTIIRYLPNGSGTGPALIVNIVASPNPSFTIWDEENDIWRAFTIGFDTDGICTIKREY